MRRFRLRVHMISPKQFLRAVQHSVRRADFEGNRATACPDSYFGKMNRQLTCKSPPRLRGYTSLRRGTSDAPLGLDSP